MPPLDFVPMPCVRCGAETEEDAATLCRPDGDDCPGEFEDGISVLPAIPSMARLNAWFEAHHECVPGRCVLIEKAAIAMRKQETARLRYRLLGFIIGLITIALLTLVQL